MRTRFSAILLAALMVCATWAATAGAVTLVEFDVTNMPPTAAGGLVAIFGNNMLFDNDGADGTTWLIPLVTSGSIGTDPFILTARFTTPLTFTGATASFELDNSSGPGDTVGRALTITESVIRLAARNGTGPSVPRPTGAFRVQLERTATQYIARLDGNDDGTFETTIGTYAMTPAARPIQIVDQEDAPVFVRSIRIEPPPPVAQATPSASAPTMGSWGAIVMALVLLVIAGMAIRAKKVSV